MVEINDLVQHTLVQHRLTPPFRPAWYRQTAARPHCRSTLPKYNIILPQLYGILQYLCGSYCSLYDIHTSLHYGLREIQLISYLVHTRYAWLSSTTIYVPFAYYLRLTLHGQVLYVVLSQQFLCVSLSCSSATQSLALY